MFKKEMHNFPDLDDEALVESYWKAVKLNLDESFICLLKNEINNRSLKIKYNN